LPPAERAGLPPLWSGRRRIYLGGLVAAGLTQAGAAGLGAVVVTRLLHAHATAPRWPLVLALVLIAVLVGGMRAVERVVSELLGQDYVHEIRLGLIRRNLMPGGVKNLGVAVARTTNDLNSVRTWISQGIAPLAVGVPLVFGAAAAMAVLDPVLVLALVPPLVLLGVGMSWATPTTYHRTRALRRARGKLSAQIADTILSARTIRAGGASVRELHKIERASHSLVRAAITRARWAGLLRGLAATASGWTTATTIAIALAAGLSSSQIVAALTIIGFLSMPLHDAGRVAEYRQTYRAARRIIGPAIEHEEAKAPAPEPAAAATPQDEAPADAAVFEGIVDAAGRRLPTVRARPGDRILLQTGDASMDSSVLDQLAGLEATEAATLRVGDVDLLTASPGRRRRTVGYAAHGALHPRTSVRRAVGYRAATPPGDEVYDLLDKVGLTERVRALPDGIETVLVRGGEPLTLPDRARLALARALFNEPPLLVFDHLDADLGQEGRAVMRKLLRDYPGVVVAATDIHHEIMETTLIWNHRKVTHATLERSLSPELMLVDPELAAHVRELFGDPEDSTVDDVLRAGR
jgi:ABC-type multidrug transport system fused ATPase/permease subunit